MADYRQTQPRSAGEAEPVARSPSRGRRTATSTLRDKAALWMTMAAMIAEQRLNASDIQKALGLKRHSVTRYLGDLDSVYGFRVSYVRPDGGFPGWYEILDWGVLDPDKVCAMYGAREGRKVGRNRSDGGG